jgi:hypothetical protein
MKALLQFLWDGCWHKWEEVRRVGCNDELGSKWERVYCRCSKCGLPKYFD